MFVYLYIYYIISVIKKMNSSYDHFLHDEKSDNMLICFIFRLDFYQLKYKICEHCIKNKNKETNLKYIYIFIYLFSFV